MSDILNQLHQVLEQRKGAAPDSSYVASLYDKGLNKILEKVGEEAVETLLAARDTDAGGDPKALINETADLWFHSLIMLAHLGLGPDQVLAELEQRFGLKDGYSRTLEEVGRQFQVTRERIRQIEAKALRKMRHPTRIRKLEGFIELPNM